MALNVNTKKKASGLSKDFTHRELGQIRRACNRAIGPLKNGKELPVDVVRELKEIGLENPTLAQVETLRENAIGARQLIRAKKTAERAAKEAAKNQSTEQQTEQPTASKKTTKKTTKKASSKSTAAKKAAASKGRTTKKAASKKPAANKAAEVPSVLATGTNG